MAYKRHNPIPEAKIKKVKELKDLLTNKKTILIASIRNLPSAQLQEISKSLRGKALVKIPKKNLFFRAIDNTKNPDLQIIKEHFPADVAVLFSDEESFKLASEILQNKTPAKAKPGQEAPEDILIQAGPTDLPPGPAISELGAVGLQVEIQDGKINIKEDKVIVEEGKEISQNAADIMSKLDIKPFSIGLIPLSAFDNTTKTFYAEIYINTEEVVDKLKNAFGRALSFAVEIGYINEDTVKFMISKAGSHEKALVKIVEEKSGSKEEKEETKTEEKKEDKSEKASETQNQTPEESKPEEGKAEEKKEDKSEKASEGEEK